MKSLIFALFVAGICGELLITKEYNEYLKSHVSWEVVDYEDSVFRGWTREEGLRLLGTVPLPTETSLPLFEVTTPSPSALNWAGADCIHAVRDQGGCGSCWAFGLAGMISDRCCLGGHDNGWLSPQELVSCDKGSYGCGGGWPYIALQYVVSAGGLVPDACFPYKAQNAPCPTKCVDGKDWQESHVCACKGPKKCLGVEVMKGCLKTGPIEVTFGVCSSFFQYKNGIYKCDCGTNYAGLHAVTAVGYDDKPECHWIVRNSWGTAWGDKGFFKMACESCGMNGAWDNGNISCDTVG